MLRVARTFFFAKRTICHITLWLKIYDMFSCFKSNLHHRIPWYLSASHTLHLPFALHHFHCLRSLCRTGIKYSAESATPWLDGSSGRIANNAQPTITVGPQNGQKVLVQVGQDTNTKSGQSRFDQSRS